MKILNNRLLKDGKIEIYSTINGNIADEYYTKETELNEYDETRLEYVERLIVETVKGEYIKWANGEMIKIN